MDVTLRRISDEIGPRDADIRRYRTEVALVERINRLYERARRIARASLAITRDDRDDNSNSPERTPHGHPVAP